MSLQGSIETFAIADVLRLLAATSKSGRLHVQGPSRAGTVWVDNARVLAADSPSTPHASGPVDILFQLLRFERGSFRFELDKKPQNPSEPLDIELALGEAESMLQEWRELEQQIPAGDSFVQLRPSLSSTSVTLSADEWTTLVAVAGGRTVADIGDTLQAGELQTARAVARLLDLGLVEIGARPNLTVLDVAPVAAVSAPAAGTPAIAAEPSAGPTSESTAVAPVPEAAEVAEPAARNGRTEDVANNGSNGVAAIAPPPAPPAPPAPSVAPSWAPAEPWSAAEVPSLVAPPTPTPAAPPVAAAPQAEEPAVEPEPEVPAAEFVAPVETELDDVPSSSFAYPPATPTSDVYSYPPAPDAPAAYPPAAPAAGPADSGYPPLPPPLPPVYGAAGAAPTLPPPPAWTPASEPGAPSATTTDTGTGTDPSWVGPLSDAIGRADTAGSPAGDLTGAAPASLVPGSWAGAVPPPPPAPTAPVGAWATPASLFESGLPERLAPPPPPPPPPVATALQSLADPSLAVSPSLLGTADGAQSVTDAESEPTVSLEDADDIERQLFNLSPRAREAVKQSSGLYDSRGRR